MIPIKALQVTRTQGQWTAHVKGRGLDEVVAVFHSDQLDMVNKTYTHGHTPIEDKRRETENAKMMAALSNCKHVLVQHSVRDDKGVASKRGSYLGLYVIGEITMTGPYPHSFVATIVDRIAG